MWGIPDLYNESSSVLSRNTYFQLLLSIQYVKFRKNGMGNDRWTKVNEYLLPVDYCTMAMYLVCRIFATSCLKINITDEKKLNPYQRKTH